MGQARSCPHCLLLLSAALALLAPAAARAQDAVENLKQALKENRLDLAENIIPKLHSLSDLRRAYFLIEWPKEPATIKLRGSVGDNLVKRVEAMARPSDPERQIAVSILIAEIAENDHPEHRGPIGKFASRFTLLLVGDKKTPGLVQSDDVRVRQAALHALGKITPLPADAMPVLRSALKSGQVGPRRIAAYALIDLIKNSAYLERPDELATIDQAVAEAVRVLSKPGEDEQVRGYCLQAVQTSATIFTDYRWEINFGVKGEAPIIQFEFDEKLKKTVLAPGLQRLMVSYRDAMSGFQAAMQKDPSIRIRLAALDAMSKVVAARNRICDVMQQQQKEPAPVLSRTELMREYAAVDPMTPLLAGQWAAIPAFVKNADDPRLKRGAMLLMERVAENLEPTLVAQKESKQAVAATMRRFVQAIIPALSDSDRFVRWSAARTLRFVSPEFVGNDAMIALGRMLIDPLQRDPDLSAAAAATIESIASSPYARNAIVFLRSAIADATVDANNRIAAMKALVAIGAVDDNRAAANEAFPELTGAVGSEHASIRRESCLTMGQLAHPVNEEQYRAAIDALQRAMRDEDSEVRLSAAEAILSLVRPR